MRDLASSLAFRPALPPTTRTDNTPFVSELIDRLGYESLTFAISAGELADADATFAVSISHSDDADLDYDALQDGTAVTAAELLGTLAAAGFGFGDDGAIRKLGYIGNRRYVQLTITPTGNSAAATFAAVAILGHASERPTT